MYEEHDTDAMHAITLYIMAGRAFTRKRSSGGEGGFGGLTLSVLSYDHQFVVHRIFLVYILRANLAWDLSRRIAVLLITLEGSCLWTSLLDC